VTGGAVVERERTRQFASEEKRGERRRAPLCSLRMVAGRGTRAQRQPAAMAEGAEPY